MVSIVTIQLHGWSGVRILVGANCFYLLQNIQTWGPPKLLRGNMVLSQDYCSQGVKLTTEVHLLLTLEWSYTATSPICLHGVDIATYYGQDGLGIESCCGH